MPIWPIYPMYKCSPRYAVAIIYPFWSFIEISSFYILKGISWEMSVALKDIIRHTTCHYYLFRHFKILIVFGLFKTTLTSPPFWSCMKNTNWLDYFLASYSIGLSLDNCPAILPNFRFSILDREAYRCHIFWWRTTTITPIKITINETLFIHCIKNFLIYRITFLNNEYLHKLTRVITFYPAFQFPQQIKSCF